MRRIIVIGGGIIGLATARALIEKLPQLEITLLEKEAGVARHQSTHNSGVLHAGLHYAPGSQKARLARAGIQAMVAFCAEHGIAHDLCGKLVLACTEEEVVRLRALYERGQQNGLIGVQWLTPAQARELEPHTNCLTALHVPEEGIVDYGAVCDTLNRLFIMAGGTVHTHAQVVKITPAGPGWVLSTPRAEFAADVIINCAGLHADRIARLAGEDPPARILPFRGEYYSLRPERRHLVRNLVYPTPDPALPFLGVHFTRRIHGGIDAGPNAVLACAREGYARSNVNLEDLAEAITYPGLWRFLGNHATSAVDEVVRSFSKTRFAAALQRMVPELRADDLLPGPSGVRAQAVLPNGVLVHDFLWLTRKNAIHVLSAPSPAATAALAIGGAIASRAAPLLS